MQLGPFVRVAFSFFCRFIPCINGKRISKNVYAKTREECEQKLAELIVQMKAEIAKLKKHEAVMSEQKADKILSAFTSSND